MGESGSVKLRQQLEDYFHMDRLRHDRHMRRLLEDNDGWCPLKAIIKFNRIRPLLKLALSASAGSSAALTSRQKRYQSNRSYTTPVVVDDEQVSVAMLAAAAKRSNILRLSDDQQMVQLSDNSAVERMITDDHEPFNWRTVYVERLPRWMSREQVKLFFTFSQCDPDDNSRPLLKASVTYVEMPYVPQSTTDKGRVVNRSWALVEFETAEQAALCHRLFNTRAKLAGNNYGSGDGNGDDYTGNNNNNNNGSSCETEMQSILFPPLGEEEMQRADQLLTLDLRQSSTANAAAAAADNANAEFDNLTINQRQLISRRLKLWILPKTEWLQLAAEYKQFLRLTRLHQHISAQIINHPDQAPDYTARVILGFRGGFKGTNKGVLAAFFGRLDGGVAVEYIDIDMDNGKDVNIDIGNDFNAETVANGMQLHTSAAMNSLTNDEVVATVSGYVRFRTTEDARRAYDALLNSPLMQQSAGDTMGDPCPNDRLHKAMRLRYLSEDEERRRWDVVMESRKKARLIKDRQNRQREFQQAVPENRRQRRQKERLAKQEQSQQILAANAMVTDMPLASDSVTVSNRQLTVKRKYPDEFNNNITKRIK